MPKATRAGRYGRSLDLQGNQQVFQGQRNSVAATRTANDHGGFRLTVQLTQTGFEPAEDSIFTVSAAGEDTGRVNGAFIMVDKVPGN